MRHLITIVALMLAAGCSTQTSTIALNDAGENRVKPEDVVEVALAPGIAERTEPMLDGFGNLTKKQYGTGAIWGRVFTGSSGAPATAEIVTSKLTESISGMGLTMRYTYTAEVRLTVSTSTTMITATGSRAAGMNSPSATRQAVELAVVDAARQAQNILKNRATIAATN